MLPTGREGKARGVENKLHCSKFYWVYVCMSTTLLGATYTAINKPQKEKPAETTNQEQGGTTRRARTSGNLFVYAQTLPNVLFFVSSYWPCLISFTFLFPPAGTGGKIKAKSDGGWSRWTCSTPPSSHTYRTCWTGFLDIQLGFGGVAREYAESASDQRHSPQSRINCWRNKSTCTSNLIDIYCGMVYTW